MADIRSFRVQYTVAEGWGRLPPGVRYQECSDVAVDSKDNVYVFCRVEHPMIVSLKANPNLLLGHCSLPSPKSW